MRAGIRPCGTRVPLEVCTKGGREGAKSSLLPGGKAHVERGLRSGGQISCSEITQRRTTYRSVLDWGPGAVLRARGSDCGR